MKRAEGGDEHDSHRVNASASERKNEIPRAGRQHQARKGKIIYVGGKYARQLLRLSTISAINIMLR
jgi:hypothetical protein